MPDSLQDTRLLSVNTVAADYVDADMVCAVPNKVPETLMDGLPTGTVGSPSEIAEAVALLSHPEAGYLIGSALNVDWGGHLPKKLYQGVL